MMGESDQVCTEKFGGDMDDNRVILENVVKGFGNTLAVDHFSAEINHGELFGLIGPDGAGKSTLFRILATLILADAGRAIVAGFDVGKDFWEIRNCVGYMPGRFSLYQDLSVEENLHFFATIFKTTVADNYDFIRDIYEQIKPFNDRRAGQLSGGMKQKLALCCALVHSPRVLLLDEPTTGVDPVSRREFWNILDHIRSMGITIIVSTPYMDEAARCDRIALLQSGKLLDLDTYAAILKKNQRPTLAVKSDNMYSLLIDMRKLAEVEDCYTFGQYHHTVFRNDEPPSTTDLMSRLQMRGHKQLQMRWIETEIEDVFIDLLKRSA